jgi:hypothetical protein
VTLSWVTDNIDIIIILQPKADHVEYVTLTNDEISGKSPALIPVQPQ